MKADYGLELPPDSIVVLDRGYNDFDLFGLWCEENVWFVTRMKANTSYRVVQRRPITHGRGVLCDQIIELTGAGAHLKCPERLRRIKYYDAETGQTLVFLTNHMSLATSTIARIYKDRWQIELFFEALKQNLKIKTFVGTNPNAVRIQIWTTLIAMLVLKYLRFRSRLDWALSNLVALLRWTLFTYRDLWDWLDDPFHVPPLGPAEQQLTLPG